MFSSPLAQISNNPMGHFDALLLELLLFCLIALPRHCTFRQKLETCRHIHILSLRPKNRSGSAVWQVFLDSLAIWIVPLVNLN